MSVCYRLIGSVQYRCEPFCLVFYGRLVVDLSTGLSESNPTRRSLLVRGRERWMGGVEWLLCPFALRYPLPLPVTIPSLSAGYLPPAATPYPTVSVPYSPGVNIDPGPACRNSDLNTTHRLRPQTPVLPAPLR